MFKIRVSLWSCTLASAFIAAAVQSTPAQTKGFSPQEMLDVLARPASEFGGKLKIAPLPQHFAEWTEEQKKVGFQQLAQRCGLMVALEHDNPAARILPPSMTNLEESELGMSVCIAAKMPDDWPDRKKYLDDAQRLIVKARSFGRMLQLPAHLAEN